LSADRLSLGFVMDPLEAIDIAGDTTFVLMLEAQQRGHEILYIDPADLSIDCGRAAAIVTPVTLKREQGNHFETGPSRRVILDEAVDVALQRKDPPVDVDYSVATQILGVCERTRVLNRPTSVLAYNEKILALHFREFMAPTIVTREREALLGFMEAQGGQMILKPLHGKGGEGIYHVSSDDRNLHALIETATDFGSRRTMAQRYLPEIRTGDKRILLLDGEFLGAVLRVPARGETRANLHVGGTAKATELSPADQKVIEKVRPVLKREGLFFVGIDMIGDYLTEVNVTSPTGVQEINALHDTRLEAPVIDAIEALV